MESILRTILYEWHDRKLPLLIPRDVEIDTKKRPGDNNATIITGFRRVGKTYVVFSAIKELLTQFDKEEVVYINFEDERLPLQIEVLTELLPTLLSTFGKKPKFLFLDELQVIPNWSKWVRRVLDSEDIQLFITGSSSKMSSYEIPTELRGRAWEQSVNPLSFSEFLRFKDMGIDFNKMEFASDEMARFNYLFDEYLKFGGLPAVVLSEPEKKQELLQSYFQTIVQLEISERNSVKNSSALRILLRLVLNSKEITLSKLHNSLKSLGIAVGKTTIENYLKYTEDSYFMKRLNIYSASVINQLQYPRKVYFVDTGFITALSTKFSSNYGQLFENAIFNRLQQKYQTLHYCKDKQGYEVDFVVLEEGKAVELYQVCFDIANEDTHSREVRSLLKIGAKLGCTKLYLVIPNKNSTDLIPPEITIISADQLLG